MIDMATAEKVWKDRKNGGRNAIYINLKANELPMHFFGPSLNLLPALPGSVCNFFS